MTEISEPKLDRPGAGLPAVELWLGRLGFAWRRRTGNWRTFDARFRAERAAIRRLVDSCDPDQRARRVLIRRAPGMEDSSRYWSVWMTLDHLRLVHLSMIRVIRALKRGATPEGTADTAAVKPSPVADAAVDAKYEQSCDALLAVASDGADLKTSARFAHPWFGPLDAAGWHALASGHLGVHRVQIGRILRGLPGPGR